MSTMKRGLMVFGWLWLSACDPVGLLRLHIVADGPGPIRVPIPNATVSLHQVRTPTAAPIEEPELTADATGLFTFGAMPYFSSTTEFTVRAPGFQSRTYRLGDVCDFPQPAEGMCRAANASVTLPKLP